MKGKGQRAKGKGKSEGRREKGTERDGGKRAGTKLVLAVPCSFRPFAFPVPFSLSVPFALCPLPFALHLCYLAHARSWQSRPGIG